MAEIRKICSHRLLIKEKLYHLTILCGFSPLFFPTRSPYWGDLHRSLQKFCQLTNSHFIWSFHMWKQQHPLNQPPLKVCTGVTCLKEILSFLCFKRLREPCKEVSKDGSLLPEWEVFPLIPASLSQNTTCIKPLSSTCWDLPQAAVKPGQEPIWVEGRACLHVWLSKGRLYLISGSGTELFWCRIQQGLKAPFCQEIERLDQLVPSHTTLKQTFPHDIHSPAFYFELLSLSQLYKVLTTLMKRLKYPPSTVL